VIAESLIGSALGGILRIAPEVMRLFDRKNERAHELAMLQAEMEFAKVKGEMHMREVEASMTVAELDAMSAAIKEQGETARAGGAFVAAISALVRPLVTYWMVVLYSAHKVAHMLIAHGQSGSWQEVLAGTWTEQDWTVLSLVLTFWFVGRVWERQRSA
jgi:hypothetical protein